MLLRAAAVVGLLLSIGCATVVPLQTATTVPKGTTRVAGQVGVAPWCGVALNFVERCGKLPHDFASPELRANGRYGLTDEIDLGASLRAATVGSHIDLGLYADAKFELWSHDLGNGRRQLVSVAPGAGFGGVLLRQFGNGGSHRAGLPVLDFALPVFFGHETESLEIVVGPRFLHRLHLDEGRVVSVPALGATVGLFARHTARWGVQLGYEAPMSMLRWGTWNLSTGFAFDLGS